MNGLAAGYIRSASASDRGGRVANEDAWLADDRAGIWLVADGVGSKPDGAGAARRTAARFAGIDTRAGWAATLDDLRERIDAAHAALATDGATSATTLCLLHIRGDHLVVMWVGDTRLYRWRGGTLDQLTRDHSLVQQLVSSGAVAVADADHHPMANVLTHAIGAGPLALGEVRSRVVAGDRYLLCSDGLYRAVADADIAAALAGSTPEDCVAALLATALPAAEDNVTLVVVHVAAVGDD